MIRYFFSRLLASIPLVLGVLTLTFALLESVPGRPSDLLLGDRPVPPEVRARIEAAYGLNGPPAVRYVRWLSAVALRGELGWSVSRSQPVTKVLARALPATLVLASVALLLHVAAGLFVGVVSAWKRGTWIDRALSMGTLTLYSMPTFWLGLLSILAFSSALRAFPPSSMHSVGAHEWPLLRRAADLGWHLVLPAAVLGLASAAYLARFLRAGVLQALGEQFARAAKARGAGEGRVLGHALRNGLLPAISVMGLSVPILVSGSLVTEVVFAWPGMGRVAYEAILAEDVPLVLACTLLSSLLVIFGNLAADVLLSVADPRIRLLSNEASR